VRVAADDFVARVRCTSRVRRGTFIHAQFGGVAQPLDSRAVRIPFVRVKAASFERAGDGINRGRLVRR
jgi:hypothetical protein